MNERIRLTKANTPRKTSPVSYRVLSDILNLYLNLAKKGSTGARNLNKKLLKQGYTWISEEKVAELTGYSIRAIRYAKKQLVEWGYLEPAEKRTKFARYIKPHSKPASFAGFNQTSQTTETGKFCTQKPASFALQSIEVSQETSISSNRSIYRGSEVYFSREILEQVRSQSRGDCSLGTGRKSEREGARNQRISSTCFSSQTHSPRKNILEYLSDFETDDLGASKTYPIHPDPKETISPEIVSNERIGRLNAIREEKEVIQSKSSPLTRSEIAYLSELNRQESLLQVGGAV